MYFLSYPTTTTTIALPYPTSTPRDRQTHTRHGDQQSNASDPRGHRRVQGVEPGQPSASEQRHSRRHSSSGTRTSHSRLVGGVAGRDGEGVACGTGASVMRVRASRV